MGVIKNFDTLATSAERKMVLNLVETALDAISPQHVLASQIEFKDTVLRIQEKTFDLSYFEKVFIIGFGKGSSGVCKYLENVLGDKITQGFDIDVVDETFQKIHYTKGTHPLPSQTNIDFTKTVLGTIADLSEKDLVLVVICGGGSAMFEQLHTISLEALAAINNALLHSSATISEINTIRKHLSEVKGGGLAKHLYPATVASLIFSDVPGNDLSVIASGPTVMNTTTLADTQKVWEKYEIGKSVAVENVFQETPTDPKYFEKVDNILMVSNMTALKAMQEKAKELGGKAVILTDRLQGDAKKIGKLLLSETKPHEILLAGGETTVHVVGKGRGGRNQTVVLAALSFLSDSEIIVSFGSDGWDYTTFAGAIGDSTTVEKAKKLGLDLKAFLDDDNSTEFFEKTGDGIDTGKLESNVSDLLIVYKK